MAMHLMISGLHDTDQYRISAENREEQYKHIKEIIQADLLINEYGIVYIDNSEVYRVNNDGDYDCVDVKNERLSWLADKASSNPEKLFVIVIYDESRNEWDGLLESFEAVEYPNVIIHNKEFDCENHNIFLSDVVDKWRSLKSI